MTPTTLQTDIIVDIYGALEDKLNELQCIESDPLKIDADSITNTALCG